MFKVRRSHLIQILLFLIVAAILLAVFAFLIGNLSGLYHRGGLYHIKYNFAGGITTGSSVRLSGIGIGRVKTIVLNSKDRLQGDPAVTVTVLVDKEATPLIRGDSQFFINMAGLMGETYLEITPGSTDQPEIAQASIVRGVDPPRIDQLISEGYALFQIANAVVTDMKPELTQFVKELKTLLAGMNESFASVPESEKKQFAKNAITLIRNLAHISHKLNSIDSQHLVELVTRLLEKADKINEATLREFLQKEGIRAKIF